MPDDILGPVELAVIEFADNASFNGSIVPALSDLVNEGVVMLMRPVRRVGRPGLVGTVARTAVVAGTATAVVGGVSRHQASKAAQSADAQAAAAGEQQAAMDAAAQQAVAEQMAAQAPPP